MSFEAFPAEVVQQFNDPGPYYVRENGKLRSPPGMGSCARSLCKPGQTTNLVIQANSTDGLENSPRKLFDITLDFVTLNIGLVDSLVGFPEVVGRQLFEASHHHGNLGLQALRLFSDAYGDAILQSINLSGHHLAVNQHSNCLAVFQYLSELEVGGCSLGDDHEILPTIANCHSLKRLGLANNRLTDVGMQRLTSPLRVMGRGPRNLRILDLSGNNLIGDKSAKLYLTAFSSLQAIDLSGCSVTSRGLDMLKSKLRLEIGASSDASPFHLPVKTIGWAFPLVAEWIVSSTALMRRAKTKASKDHAPGASKAINFYGRALKRLENVSGSSLSETTRPVFPIVRLVAATALGSQPTSDPVENEVSMSEVSNAVERRSKKCVPCQQTGEDNRSSKDVNSYLSKIEEALIGQYSISAKHKFHKNKPASKQEHWSSFDSDFDEPNASGGKPILKHEPTRIGKPPPKKRIKLCSKVSRGFSDILQDPQVDDVECVKPRPKKKSVSCQQISNRQSEDEVI